jgi:hypothetical protein
MSTGGNTISGGLDMAVTGRLGQVASARGGNGWQQALEQAFVAMDDPSGQSPDGDRGRPSAQAPDAPADDGAGRGPAAKPAREQPGMAPVAVPVGITVSGAGAESAPAVANASARVAASASQGEHPHDIAARLACSAYASPADGAEPQDGPAADTAAQAVDIQPDDAHAATLTDASPHNLFIERTEHGAVAWIRDPAATPERLEGLVNALTRQARAAGVTLRGIRLNGRSLDERFFAAPKDGSQTFEATAGPASPTLSTVSSRR